MAALQCASSERARSSSPSARYSAARSASRSTSKKCVHFEACLSVTCAPSTSPRRRCTLASASRPGRKRGWRERPSVSITRARPRRPASASSRAKAVLLCISVPELVSSSIARRCSSRAMFGSPPTSASNLAYAFMILVLRGWYSRPRSNSTRALSFSLSAAMTRGHTRYRCLSLRCISYARRQNSLASSGSPPASSTPAASTYSG
mmetsp:Transcript_3841/g.10376  ORF Transcript_3841/g.10376 Transcript_3841/m.10376 type:complete len:206 (-) Transcript_3841:726-1343(-)